MNEQMPGIVCYLTFICKICRVHNGNCFLPTLGSAYQNKKDKRNGHRTFDTP